MFIEFTIIKVQVCNPFCYSDVVFVKYRCPLHRSAMYTKTGLVFGFSKNQILVAVILGQNSFWVLSENYFEMSIISGIPGNGIFLHRQGQTLLHILQHCRNNLPGILL